MIIERLELVDFRNYRHGHRSTLTAGTTVVVGDNGQGKTNFAEAMAYLATLGQLPGAPPEALVRVGAERGVRARRRARRRRAARPGRGRARARRAQPRPGQPPAAGTGPRPARRRARHGVLARRPHAGQGRARPIGGASSTTRWSRLAVKYDAARLELDRIVRQRNMLLRQCRRSTRRDDSVRRSTCGTPGWPRRGSSSVMPGPRWWRGSSRTSRPRTTSWPATYDHVGLSYDPPWRRSGWPPRLLPARERDVRRGVSTVGPHRDELTLRDRRPAGAHPRLAGGAAHARAGAASRRPTG